MAPSSAEVTVPVSAADAARAGDGPRKASKASIAAVVKTKALMVIAYSRRLPSDGNRI
jgi:hypothetical protein